MSALADRLRRMERIWQLPPGCDLCRHWTVLITDGVVCHRPEVCPSCGRHVPATVTIVLPGVEEERL